MRPAKSSMIVPWKVATVAPPAHLPTTIAPRRTGATSISRRKPNSRSQTIEIAENSAVNRTVIAITPGNMKVRKSTPPLEGSIRARPLPRMKRNSTGCINEVTIRSRLRAKRSSSRRQTTRTARKSSRIPPPASRTPITSIALATG